MINCVKPTQRPPSGARFIVLARIAEKKGAGMILKAMKKINSVLIWILIAEVAIGLVVFVADGFKLI